MKNSSKEGGPEWRMWSTVCLHLISICNHNFIISPSPCKEKKRVMSPTLGRDLGEDEANLREAFRWVHRRLSVGFWPKAYEISSWGWAGGADGLEGRSGWCWRVWLWLFAEFTVCFLSVALLLLLPPLPPPPPSSSWVLLFGCTCFA